MSTNCKLPRLLRRFIICNKQKEEEEDVLHVLLMATSNNNQSCRGVRVFRDPIPFIEEEGEEIQRPAVGIAAVLLLE